MSTKQCPYCNAIIPVDAVFCPNCGAQLTAPQPQPTYQPPPQPTYAPQPPAPPAPAMPPVYPQQPIKEKSSAIAAILSFLIPGVGQIYVGKAKRGILILILGIVIAMFSMFLFFIPYLIYWLWNIYDAYSLANKYNEEYKRLGQPPW